MQFTVSWRYHTCFSDASVNQGTVEDSPLLVVRLENVYLGSIVAEVTGYCEELASMLLTTLLL